MLKAPAAAAVATNILPTVTTAGSAAAAIATAEYVNHARAISLRHVYLTACKHSTATNRTGREPHSAYRQGVGRIPLQSLRVVNVNVAYERNETKWGVGKGKKMNQTGEEELSQE